MNKKKRVNLIIFIILIAVAAAGGLAWTRSRNQTKEKVSTSLTVVPWDVNIPEEDKPTEGGKILLPGYSSMTMKAGTKEQEVNIGNPADNNCYFIITLKLEDGTELFKSDYLKPGEGLKNITLNQTLKSGQYQAVVEYKCYSLQDQSQLNGGSSGFTLTVNS